MAIYFNAIPDTGTDKAKYSCLAIRDVTNDLIWLNIPKYFTSEAQTESTWTFQYEYNEYPNYIISFIK